MCYSIEHAKGLGVCRFNLGIQNPGKEVAHMRENLEKALTCLDKATTILVIVVKAGKEVMALCKD